MLMSAKRNFINRFGPRMDHERLLDLIGPLSFQRFDQVALDNLAKFCDTHSATKADTRGGIPLHMAAHKDAHSTVIDLFIRSGEDINHTDEQSFSALHVACTEGNEKVVQHLLQNGIDANNRTSIGYDAAMCALSGLLQPSINHSPARLRRIQCCLMVIDHIQDINYKTKSTGSNNGFCLLKLAVDVSALLVVLSLVRRGAQIPDHDGLYREAFDAIMHSAVSGASFGRFKGEGLDILRVLLLNGGNPNERLTHPRRYLLDYRHELPEVATLLKLHGAKSFAENSREIFGASKAKGLK